MAFLCWHCGAENVDHVDLCVHCGESIGVPSVQLLGAQTPHLPSFEATICPTCLNAIPADSPMCPRCGTGESQAWPLTGDSPPPLSGMALERSPDQPATPPKRRSKLKNKVAIALGAAVLAVAAVGLTWGLLGQSGSPPPQDVPAMCAAVSRDSPSRYSLSGDEFDSFVTFFDSPDMKQIDSCVDAGDTYLKAAYQVPQSYHERAINLYTNSLQNWAGFTVGHSDATGAELWRKSVDAGQVLYMQILSSPDELTVEITKGVRDLVPGNLIAGTSDLPDQVSGEGGTLSFTPAPSWRQFAWQGAWNGSLRYNKIVDDAVVGTLAVVTGGIDSPWPLTGDPEFDLPRLTDLAKASLHALAPSVPDTVIASPTQIVINGVPAVQYTFTYQDSMVRYISLQSSDGKTYFNIVAEVYSASTDDPMSDIQAMIDSMLFSE